MSTYFRRKRGGWDMTRNTSKARAAAADTHDLSPHDDVPVVDTTYNLVSPVSTVDTRQDLSGLPKMDKKAVGQMVWDAWKSSGVQQKVLLERMQIQRSHFNKIARAVYSPNVQFLTDFAEAIGGRLVLDVEGPNRQRVTLVVKPEVAMLVEAVQSLLDPETREAITVIVLDEQARAMFSDLVKRIADGIAKPATGGAL